MKRLSRILLAAMVVFALALGACGDDDDDNDVSPDDDDTTGDDDTSGDDDTGDDDDTTGDDDDDNDDKGFSDDFESYTVGNPPTDPWVSDLTTATADVIALDKDGSGKAVELNDTTSAAGSLSVDLSDLSFLDSSEFTLTFDWLWVSGEGNSVRLNGGGDLQTAVDFYIDRIEAAHNQGWTTCATGTNFDQWYAFDVVVDPVNETYTVYIDGVESDCSNLGFVYAGYGYSLDTLELLMYTNITGVTRFDNVEISEN